ncbi:MAG: NifU-like protein involved in Fe-S cluster formation [Gammaproteobacteria bacterium]
MTEQELQELYAQVVALAQDIPLNERLANATASVTMVSPLCGSQVTADLIMDGDRVSQFGQKVRACTLGAAAASIVARHVEGKSADELRALRERMRDMLKNEGSPPDGDFAQLAILEPARDLISRHGSIMLIFDAIGEALDEVQGRQKVLTGGKGIPDTVRA